MGLFGQMMRKLCKQLQTLQEKHVEASMPVEAAVKEMQPLDHDMEEEQEKAGQKVIADENRCELPPCLVRRAHVLGEGKSFRLRWHSMLLTLRTTTSSTWQRQAALCPSSAR